MDKLIKNYLRQLKTKKKRSDRTIRNYSLYLRRFAEWCKIKKIPAENLVLADLKKYQKELNERRDELRKKFLKGSTKNYHIIALREFIKFLIKRNIISIKIYNLKLEKIKRRKIEQLTDSEIQKFLDAPLNFSQEKILQLRDKAILEVLFSTGLKVSEIINLKNNDFEKNKNFTLHVGGKKKRLFVLNNQSAYWLDSYLKNRPGKIEYLFVSHDRAKNSKERFLINNLSARTVERIIEKYKKFIGLRKALTPEIFRFYFANKMVRQGVNEDNLQEMLGHQSKNTTKLYFDSH